MVVRGYIAQYVTLVNLKDANHTSSTVHPVATETNKLCLTFVYKPDT